MSQRQADRRLETLSDIVFGLAMTFLVSRLPLPGKSDPAPTWHDLAVQVGPSLAALGLSFSVAGVFWFGNHRRLALTQSASAVEIVLNFAFLLVVMLLPATTELYARYQNHGSMVSIYSAHLALLAGLYLVLWMFTILRSRRQLGGPALPWTLLSGPAFACSVFLCATLLAFFRPALSQSLLWAAFFGPFVTRLLAREQR